MPTRHASLPPRRRAAGEARGLLERLQDAVVAGVVDERPAEAVERRRELVEVAELAPQRTPASSSAIPRPHLPLRATSAPERRQRAGTRAARPPDAASAAASRPQPSRSSPRESQNHPSAPASSSARSGSCSGSQSSAARRSSWSRSSRCGPLGLGVEAMLVGLFGKRREERGVAPAQLVPLAPARELLEGVLADRLEHEEPVVADRLHEAVVDERCRGRRAPHRRPPRLPRVGTCRRRRRGGRRVPGRAVRGGRSSIRSSLAASAGARARHGHRPSGRRARSRAARAAARARAASSAPRPARSRAGGRRGGGRSLHGRVGGDLAPDRPGALGEERGRLLLRERLEPVLVLARDTKRRPARDEHSHLGAGAEDRADDRSGVEEVLEVVEEEQELPPAEESREVVGGTDRLGDLRGQELGIREARERHPEDTVVERPDEFRRDLEREACLSRTARACDGDEARPFESIATSSSSSRSRPMSGIETTGRLVASSVRRGGKSPSPSWKRRSAPIRSFRRCSPRSRTERLRRAGAASSRRRRSARRARGRDPRRAVDVHADVALVGHERLAGVDAHPDPDRPGFERPLRLGRGGDGVGRPRERDEKRVALRVHLDAVVSRAAPRGSRAGALRGDRRTRARAREGGGSTLRRR